MSVRVYVGKQLTILLEASGGDGDAATKSPGNATASLVIAKICAETGSQQDQLQLLFKGELLEGRRSLSSYGIFEDSELMVVPKS